MNIKDFVLKYIQKVSDSKIVLSNLFGLFSWLLYDSLNMKYFFDTEDQNKQIQDYFLQQITILYNNNLKKDKFDKDSWLKTIISIVNQMTSNYPLQTAIQLQIVPQFQIFWNQFSNYKFTNEIDYYTGLLSLFNDIMSPFLFFKFDKERISIYEEYLSGGSNS